MSTDSVDTVVVVVMVAVDAPAVQEEAAGMLPLTEDTLFSAEPIHGISIYYYYYYVWV